jgi:uncharacterized protein YegP (UPF0339 family)
MKKIVKSTIEIYKDRKGELRWRLTFRGKKLADSGEGYKRYGMLIKALTRVFRPGYQSVYNVVDNTRLT